MHASLAELLENLRPGLLWVTRDGVVRYANGEAAARTGLAAGRKLYDPDLSRAVGQSVAGRVPRTLTATGVLDGTSTAELKCRVIPGLAQDDAFVLIGQQPGADDGAGFDNLMQAIRTDVRDPLRSAKAALEVVNAQEGTAEMQALSDGVGQVLEVVDKLVELATLWGSGTLFANDRIELWPLLQQVWAEIEPLALDRSVKVRFHAQAGTDSLATMYGSERWLKRVFVECLEAAVRATQRGSMLEIEHRQMGPRALIVFRDCGVFAARVTNGAGMPMPSQGKPGAKNAPVLPAREQIGLKLCQHIVSLHGGHLREEHDDGQRNFMIELPTGAPHRDAGPQLDIAQAQRYASDLAALMTRARQRGAATPSKTPAGPA
jgi:signal transduction histidine kinase